MNSTPHEQLTETEIETLQRMQNLLKGTFDYAADNIAKALVRGWSAREDQLLATATADSYVRVTELLSKNRKNGP